MVLKAGMQVAEQNASRVGDAVAYGGILGNLMGYLPDVAVVLSIVWISIQIFQAVTGVKLHEWIKRKRKPKED